MVPTTVAVRFFPQGIESPLLLRIGRCDGCTGRTGRLVGLDHRCSGIDAFALRMDDVDEHDQDRGERDGGGAPANRRSPLHWLSSATVALWPAFDWGTSVGAE